MFGAGVDTLNVYLKQNNKLGLPVWSRYNNQGNKWLRGELRIADMKSPYQIVFEGIRGSIWSVSQFN